MRVIRVRILILLSVIYAALLFLLYQYVWHSRRNDDAGGLFDSPGQDDLPRVVNDIVQFNFKRRNGPPLMESNDTFDVFFNSSYGGDDLANNSVVPSVQNPVLDKPDVPNHGSRLRVENELTNSSIEEGEHTSHLSKHTRNSLAPLYDVSHLDPPNYCIHAFYYMWYGNPEFDGQYLHWNHRYLPHWEQRVTDQHPKGRHIPPDDIGANFYPGWWVTAADVILCHKMACFLRKFCFYEIYPHNYAS